MTPALLLLAALAAEGWTVHTPEALATEIQAACARATAAEKPVLLGFSAPWCLDCKVLHKLESDPKVQAELANWERVVTDVGRFERHQSLLKELDGDRLAWWAALKPTAAQCADSPATWPRLKVGGIEPASSKKLQTVDDIVGWLTTARGG